MASTASRRDSKFIEVFNMTKLKPILHFVMSLSQIIRSDNENK